MIASHESALRSFACERIWDCSADHLMRLKRVLGAKPDQTRALMSEKHS